MKLLAIQSSTNHDGLTASMAQIATGHAESLGAATELMHLNDMGVSSCRACGFNGWGTCRATGKCQVDDGFEPMRRHLEAADAIVLATPVYWGDLSESAKCLLDRLRRCEFQSKDSSKLLGKPLVGIVCAGGSGRGTEGATRAIQAYVPWVHVREIAIVPINRANRVEQEPVIRQATADALDAIGK